jgi:hypothetical protein
MKPRVRIEETRRADIERGDSATPFVQVQVNFDHDDGERAQQVLTEVVDEIRVQIARMGRTRDE